MLLTPENLLNIAERLSMRQLICSAWQDCGGIILCVSVTLNNYVGRNDEGHTSVLYLRCLLEPESNLLLAYSLGGVHNYCCSCCFLMKFSTCCQGSAVFSLYVSIVYKFKRCWRCKNSGKQAGWTHDRHGGVTSYREHKKITAIAHTYIFQKRPAKISRYYSNG